LASAIRRKFQKLAVGPQNSHDIKQRRKDRSHRMRDKTRGWLRSKINFCLPSKNHVVSKLRGRSTPSKTPNEEVQSNYKQSGHWSKECP
jgi:hypothetical protein